FDLKPCFNVRMSHDSPRAEQLADILTREAVTIAKAISSAPPWRRGWPKKAAAEFFQAYYRGEPPTEVGTGVGVPWVVLQPQEILAFAAGPCSLSAQY